MSCITTLRGTLLAAAVAAVAIASPAGAQTQSGAPAAAAPVTPAAGEAAPDFMAMATDSTGKVSHVMLSSLRGKVVVLAFYPGDRTSGCTAELNKFRDEYATLFGDGVVVLPTSSDSLGSHSSWARDAHFPFAMISDPTTELATKFGTQGNGKYFKRSVFVIGKNGKIVYAEPKFNALAQDGYDKLAAAIKQARAN
ncbi:MAG: redoxin domain-containing protein [Gemmatimonadaceae bacterium]